MQMKIILESIFVKLDGKVWLWTRGIWLRIRTSGGLLQLSHQHFSFSLCAHNKKYWSHKMLMVKLLII